MQLENKKQDTNNKKQAIRDKKQITRNNIFLENLYLDHCIFSQQGVGLLAVMGIVAVVIIGAIALTTPQIRQTIFPTPKPSQNEASSSAMTKYSDKQLLYLRNKQTIMKNLNLNEEQFNLLVESANKN